MKWDFNQKRDLIPQGTLSQTAINSVKSVIPSSSDSVLLEADKTKAVNAKAVDFNMYSILNCIQFVFVLEYKETKELEGLSPLWILQLL